MYFKHGRSGTPEYVCWKQIKARCLNPNHRAYPDYGGRGIAIHEMWIDDFEAFLTHVGLRPSPKFSLDRINNERGYEPGNLRWTDRKQQSNNCRPHRRHGERVRRPVRGDGKPTNFKHGMMQFPEYASWSAMKDRCLNPNSSNYPNWGGRGIKIHPVWIDDFMAFYWDVGPRPSPKHSLDRIDNAGHYVPGNVRWATRLEQTQNRRPCKTGEAHGNFEHGYTKSPTYKVWGSIKTRCFNSNHDGYVRYGALGITMCQRWRESFEAFLEDLGPKPAKCNLTRQYHEGHYSCGKCPECLSHGWTANCRWATSTEINRSRRPSAHSGKLGKEKAQQIRQLLFKGTPVKDVAEMFGINRSLVGKIRRGENWA